MTVLTNAEKHIFSSSSKSSSKHKRRSVKKKNRREMMKKRRTPPHDVLAKTTLENNLFVFEKRTRERERVNKERSVLFFFLWCVIILVSFRVPSCTFFERGERESCFNQKKNRQNKNERSHKISHQFYYSCGKFFSSLVLSHHRNYY